MESRTQDSAANSDWIRISTRTERRALDWSLVLASQQIPSIIENHPAHGWGLLVPPECHSRARESIGQYLRENRRWPWQQKVFKRETLFDWGALAWVGLTILVFHWQQSHAELLEYGALDTLALNRGEWWRLFTAELLHGNLLHLAANSVFGFLLLGLAMGRFGTGLGLLAAYLAGTVGNLVSWFAIRHAHTSLGASGVVMGALGLLAAQSFGATEPLARSPRSVLRSLAGGLMLFVLLGLSPDSDIAAHLGGFVAGVILGLPLVAFPCPAIRTRLNLLAMFCFLTLVIWPWLQALSPKHFP